MTFRVLEGHLHIARIFKCDLRILARLMVPLHLQSFLYSMLCCGVGFSGSLTGDIDSSQQSQPEPVVVSDVPAASTASTTASTSCVGKPVSAAEGNLRPLLAFRVDAEDDVLKQHLATAGKNAIYISRTSQNEMIP